MDFTLAAAIIVKDAEDTIARAIESVKDIASEIIVADTGSADRTPLICSRLGGEVHFFHWTGSFAEARNFTLRLANSEWIMIIDADEELDAKSFRENAYLLRNKNISGINIKIRNLLGNSEEAGHTEHRYTRIFRNLPGIKFEGRIHEQVRESVEAAGGEIVETDIIINHYGYIDNKKEKAGRNLGLLRRDLEERPDDPWVIYHMADSEFTAENLDRAYELFENVYNSPMLSAQQQEFSRLRLAQIELKNNQFDKCGRWLGFRSDDPDREGFRRFVLAAALMNTGRFAEAIELYESDEAQNSALINKEQLRQAIGVARRASGAGNI
jgi:glycosyltransferase involved in cell wall biosynthesis